MKKLRALYLFVWASVALSVGSLAGTVERLEHLAATDLLPEIRAAAALGLAQLWVDDAISNDALARIAQMGGTKELRQAAAQALAARTVTDALDAEALKALVVNGAFEAVRQRAAMRLSELLLAAPPSLSELEQTVEQGEPEALRQAAVPALAQGWASASISNEALLSLANTGASAELRQAAAQALAVRLEEEFATFSGSALAGVIGGDPFEITRIVGSDSAALRQAAAQALVPHFQSTPLGALEATAADPANSVELRRAAATVLGQRLLGARRSLEALTELAGQGATPEVQQAAVAALEQALVFAVGLGQFTLQTLVDTISPTDSDALNQARANAAFTLLRPNLIFVTDQPLLEALIEGQAVTIGGVLVDGQNRFLRQAATDFLAGLFLQFGAVNRFEDPLNDLLAMASDATTAAGFRQAAGAALVKFLSAQRQKALDTITQITRLLDRIVIQGRRGQSEDALALLEQARLLIDTNSTLINTTAEAAGELGAAQRLRSIKDRLAEFPEAIRQRNNSALRDINTFVSGEFSQIQVGLANAPDTDDETLIAMAGEGATVELRQAAATVLSGRLQEALAAGTTNLEALLALAQTGASSELQGASEAALAQALSDSERSDEALLTLALEGQTAALQAAGARAWMARQERSVDAVMALANGAGLALGTLQVRAKSPEFQQALAPLLKARWLQEAVSAQALLDVIEGADNEVVQQTATTLLGQRFFEEGKTQQELIALAVSAESGFVRQAASDALTQLLMAQQLSEPVLFNLISQFTLAGANPSSSEELVQALIVALADRFLHPLVPTPGPSTSVELSQP